MINLYCKELPRINLARVSQINGSLIDKTRFPFETRPLQDKKVRSALVWIRSMFCSHLCGSVKWLYLAEPRVGWVRSLPLPGLSNTTPTTISVGFIRTVWSLYHISSAFTEPKPGGWKPDSIRCKGWE